MLSCCVLQFVYSAPLASKLIPLNIVDGIKASNKHEKDRTIVNCGQILNITSTTRAIGVFSTSLFEHFQTWHLLVVLVLLVQNEDI